MTGNPGTSSLPCRGRHRTEDAETDLRVSSNTHLGKHGHAYTQATHGNNRATQGNDRAGIPQYKRPLGQGPWAHIIKGPWGRAHGPRAHGRSGPMGLVYGSAVGPIHHYVSAVAAAWCEERVGYCTNILLHAMMFTGRARRPSDISS